MEEKLNLFFNRLTTDLLFRQKFMSTKTAEEGYDLAKPYLENVTFVQFKEGLTRFYAGYRPNGKVTLSRNEYRMVAGGVASWGDIISFLNDNKEIFLS